MIVVLTVGVILDPLPLLAIRYEELVRLLILNLRVGLFKNVEDSNLYPVSKFIVVYAPIDSSFINVEYLRPVYLALRAVRNGPVVY